MSLQRWMSRCCAHATLCREPPAQALLQAPACMGRSPGWLLLTAPAALPLPLFVSSPRPSPSLPWPQLGYYSKHLLSQWPSCTRFYLVDLWGHQDNYEDVANVDQQAQVHWVWAGGVAWRNALPASSIHTQGRQISLLSSCWAGGGHASCQLSWQLPPQLLANAAPMPILRAMRCLGDRAGAAIPGDSEAVGTVERQGGLPASAAQHWQQCFT